MSKSEPLPEGTVIMADHQYAGRGQLDSVWHAEPGKNLTMSLFLKPDFLPISQQFLLNMAVSVAVNQALVKFVDQEVKIKWPNDIFYHDKKLGGILIENTIQRSAIKTAVIGIGINVNQQHFQPTLSDKATSLVQILHKDVNLQLLLNEICSQIEYLYSQLKNGVDTFLRKTYVERLYRINERHYFKHNDKMFEGTITSVTDQGLLNVQVEHEIKQFNFKEIEFLNHNK